METAVADVWAPATLEALLLVMAGGCGILWLALTQWKRGAQRARRLVFMAFVCLLALVFARTWFLEPFHVPSASMVPTIHVGDLLLVQKYAYRVVLPVTGQTLMETGKPQRGDIVVFTLESEPDIRYVKRVLGVGGDEVVRLGHQWFVNGKELPQSPSGIFEGTGQGPELEGVAAFSESLAGRDYYVMADVATDVEHWRVPEGQLFALGDNRGMSRDSRDFGFVHQDRLIGRVGRVLVNMRTFDQWAQPVGGDFPPRLR